MSRVLRETHRDGGDRAPHLTVGARSRPGVSWRVWLFVILLAGGLAASLFPSVRAHLRPEELRGWIGAAGWKAFPAYVFVLVLGEFLWMPRMVLITAGGLFFAPWIAGGLSVLADLLGGSLFFWMARSLARPTVERWLAGRRRLEAFADLVARRHGLSVVALLRISPVAHYTAFSYGCGLWGISYGPYLAGTFFGVLPGAMLYPYFGNAAMHPGSPAFWMALTALVIFLVGTLWLGRRLSQEAEGSDVLDRRKGAEPGAQIAGGD